VVNRVSEVSGECSRLKVTLSVMQVGCTTLVVAKRLVYEGSGVSWVVGTHSGGVLRALVVCPVVSGLSFVVLSGAGHEIRPASTYASTMTP
jgi:hypothetical protein